VNILSVSKTLAFTNHKTNTIYRNVIEQFFGKIANFEYIVCHKHGHFKVFVYMLIYNNYSE